MTGYKVYRDDGLTTDELEATLDDVLEYSDTELPNGATFTYRVRALNAAGEGAASGDATMTTWDLSGVPGSLAATPGIDAVGLAWSTPTTDGGTPVTGYRVYRGPAPGQETLLDEVGAVLSYEDATADGGSRYHYLVAAVNAAGEGAASNAASARPYDLLVEVPVVVVPPDGVEAKLQVCDAGSSVGCEVPGSGFFCMTVTVAGGPPIPPICIDHGAVPPEIHDALHAASPVVVGLPPPVASTPMVQVVYKHERDRLSPVPPACLPVAPVPAEAEWLLAAGSETLLELRIAWTDPTGEQLAEAVPVAHLGQLVAAAQATAGTTPC